MTDMNQFSLLFKAICEDASIRHQLLNQPDEILKQYSLALPANIELKSVEDCMHAPNCIHVTVKEAGSLCVRADNAAEC